MMIGKNEKATKIERAGPRREPHKKRNWKEYRALQQLEVLQPGVLSSRFCNGKWGKARQFYGVLLRLVNINQNSN